MHFVVPGWPYARGVAETSRRPRIKSAVRAVIVFPEVGIGFLSETIVFLRVLDGGSELAVSEIDDGLGVVGLKSEQGEGHESVGIPASSWQEKHCQL